MTRARGSLLAPPLFIRRLFGRMHTVSELTDPSRRERVRLCYVRFGSGSDFHSIVWEHSDGVSWKRRARTLPRDLARAEIAFVSSIHSFDPAEGTAVIHAAAMRPSVEEPGRTDAVFSWRSWDLLNNRQIAILQECAVPWERYRGGHDG